MIAHGSTLCDSNPHSPDLASKKGRYGKTSWPLAIGEMLITLRQDSNCGGQLSKYRYLSLENIWFLINLIFIHPISTVTIHHPCPCTSCQTLKASQPQGSWASPLAVNSSWSSMYPENCLFSFPCFPLSLLQVLDGLMSPQEYIVQPEGVTVEMAAASWFIVFQLDWPVDVIRRAPEEQKRNKGQ